MREALSRPGLWTAAVLGLLCQAACASPRTGSLGQNDAAPADVGAASEAAGDRAIDTGSNSPDDAAVRSDVVSDVGLGVGLDLSGTPDTGRGTLPPDAGGPSDAPARDVLPPDTVAGPVTCPAGSHLCGEAGAQECKSDSDWRSCGSSCSPCPLVDRADPVCSQSRTCDFNCRSGSAACTSQGTKTSCGQTSWDFEGGATPWRVSGTDDSALVSAWTIAAGRATSGTHAMQADVRVSSGQNHVLIGESLCPGSTVMDRRGRTLSLQMYVEGGPSGATHECAIAAYARVNGMENVFIGPPGAGRPLIARTGQWSTIQYRIVEAQAASSYYIYLTCYLSHNGTTWTGTVTIDDIKIE